MGGSVGHANRTGYEGYTDGMISDSDDDYVRAWFATDGGETLGARGPEGEDVDARLTLEGSLSDADGYTVVAQLYGGWLYETVDVTGRADADAMYETLKPRLEELADLIPLEDDRDIPARLAALNDAVARFRAD
jgi:hypothetical protein